MCDKKDSIRLYLLGPNTAARVNVHSSIRFVRFSSLQCDLIIKKAIFY